MRVLQTFLATAALAACASPASAVLIDNFSDASGVFVTPGPGSASTSTVDAAPLGSIVGGVRDSTAINVSGGGLVDVFTKPGTGLGATPVIAYASAPGVVGGFTLVYTGGGSGLGGVDLTDGGASNAFNIGVNFSDFPSSVVISVSDTSTAFDTAGPFALPPLITGGSPVGVPIPFSAFTGVDFTTIDSIGFAFDAPVAATDLELLFLETTSTIPEPTAVGLLALMGGAGLAWRRR